MSVEKRTAVAVSLVRVAVGGVAVARTVGGLVGGLDRGWSMLPVVLEGVTGAGVLLGVFFRPCLALLALSLLVGTVGASDGAITLGAAPYAAQSLGVLAALALVGPGRYTLGWVVRRFRGAAISYPVTRQPTDIFGLKYLPTLAPRHSDDADFIVGKPVDAEVTPRNLRKLEEIVLATRQSGKLIVEIGVCRNAEGSFTHVLLRHKPRDAVYLGIDMDDKSFLDDPARSIHTLRTDSRDQDLVRAKIKELGGPPIGILFIDGWHSVNVAVNDWKYADLLAEDGVVVLHDTNCHPGPVCLFDAVDERLFHKEKFFERERDWGMAVFRRRR
ncbi:MAG: hypothetical protein A2X36_02270 [Elusimicrobia bacterium GWA2_69_24]|nr:MAG: hypothetical protein A2W08_17010 [Candidatus Rokubacteria bacterium RBG_16_73_20]OGR60875.1 MAG: hypothetical protein A2X36_02270 [Elusimicrobia bacterium GWA2_69_24]HBH00787.1 hypothetical protein [Candidatus Rokubacteria bacterium]